MPARMDAAPPRAGRFRLQAYRWRSCFRARRQPSGADTSVNTGRQSDLDLRPALVRQSDFSLMWIASTLSCGGVTLLAEQCSRPACLSQVRVDAVDLSLSL